MGFEGQELKLMASAKKYVNNRGVESLLDDLIEDIIYQSDKERVETVMMKNSKKYMKIMDITKVPEDLLQMVIKRSYRMYLMNMTKEERRVEEEKTKYWLITNIVAINAISCVDDFIYEYRDFPSKVMVNDLMDEFEEEAVQNDVPFLLKVFTSKVNGLAMAAGGAAHEFTWFGGSGDPKEMAIGAALGGAVFGGLYLMSKTIIAIRNANFRKQARKEAGRK